MKRVLRPFVCRAPRYTQVSFSTTWLAACLLLLCSFLSPTLRGQGLSGISGTVTDPSGAVVAGAKVPATNDATGVATHSVTSAARTYNFTNLIPALYTASVDVTLF